MKKSILLSVLIVFLLSINIITWMIFNGRLLYITPNAIFSLIIISIIIYLIYNLYNQGHLKRKYNLELDMRKKIKKSIGKLYNKNIFNTQSSYDKDCYILTGESGSGKKSYLKNNKFKLIDSICNGNVSIWINVSSVIFLIEEDNKQFCFFSEVAHALMKYRARRAIDGIIFISSCQYLLELNDSVRLSLAQKRYSIINKVNIITGLDLPITLLHSYLDILKDFHSYIISLESKVKDDLLSWRLDNKHTQFFEDEYDENINNILLNLVSEQYQQLYFLGAAADVVSFPYQFKMLLLSLGPYFKTIQGNKQQNISLYICNIAFYCQKISNPKFDLLSETLNNELKGVVHYHNSEETHLDHSFFMDAIFNSLILRGKLITNVNKYYNNKYYITNALKTFLLFSILAFSIYQLNNNWSLNNQWIAKVTDRLDTFNKNYNKDLSIEDKIRLIFSIEELVDESKLPLSWYQYISFRQNNINEALNDFYINMIKKELFPLVEDVLKELIIDSVMKNESDLYQAVYHYKMLYHKDMFNSESMSDYIADNAEQVNIDNLAEFARLIQNMPVESIDDDRVDANADLVKRAETIISNTQIEKIIYQKIKQYPKFRTKISLAQLFSSDIERVFIVGDSDSQPFEIPFIFTKEGYQQVDFSSNSALIKDEMIKIKKMQGQKTTVNLLELAQMSKRINNLYISEYIQIWSDIISSLKIKPITTKRQLIDSMQLLSNTDNNLIVDLMQFITANTKLVSEQLPDLAGSKSVTSQLGLNKVNKVLKKADRIEKALGNKSMELQSGYRINKAFNSYHKLVKPTASGDLPMAELVEQLNKLATIWHTDGEQAKRGEFFYQIAQGHINQSDDILNRLIATSQKYPVSIQKWIDELIKKNWQFILNESALYLDTQWQENVYSSYQSEISGRFPFSDSPHDVSLSALNNFFQAQGTFNEFIKQLAPFINSDKRRITLKSIDNQSLPLSSYFMAQVNNAREIQRLFFINENETAAQMEISIKPITLSPTLTEVQLHDNQLRFRYRHGPRLWAKIGWPETGMDGELYFDFYKDNVQLYSKSYAGQWGLFRLLFSQSMDMSQSYLPRIDFNSGKYQFSFEYQVNQESMILSRQFFDRLSFPMTILTYDQENN